ncbi:hypothetical protein PpBr36_04106 [Pyricularia pennisetigena]|uniref:hypothetical protein n=1 Tax=Pyricularia pennisetigena TaxID=1578925 RepID=UPI001151368D|nr:hypothetical protein PpBr36_04106 [Pyricularia pennisetigena]TLS27442.1 hypothetical protein PpBr36_04106 [Pyricularia pennisetigena]
MPRFGSMFRRRPRDNNESPELPTHNRHWRRGRAGRDRVQVESYTMKKRPPFLEWLKISALDIVTLIVMAVLSYVFFSREAVGHRTFPVTFTQSTTSSPSISTRGSGDIVYPQFAHPYRPQIISSEQAGVMAIATPIIVFLLAQIRIRSFWDLNNSIFGLLYAVVGGTLFQVIIKWLIGGLRPNFLDVCKPDISRASRPGGNSTGLEGTGFGGIMYTFEICSALDDQEKRRGVFNALQSFPSGHTTTSFAGFIFLYLYLNAKLKVFSNYHPSFWKLALTYAPVLCATLIAGSLTVDQSHNWRQRSCGTRVAGAAMVLGAFLAALVDLLAAMVLGAFLVGPLAAMVLAALLDLLAAMVLAAFLVGPLAAMVLAAFLAAPLAAMVICMLKSEQILVAVEPMGIVGAVVDIMAAAAVVLLVVEEALLGILEVEEAPLGILEEVVLPVEVEEALRGILAAVAGDLPPLITLVVEALWVQEPAPGALPEEVVVQVLPGVVVVQVRPEVVVQVLPGAVVEVLPAAASVGVAAGELLPLICLLKIEQALVVEALWVQELAPEALPEQVVQVLPGVVVQVLPAASVGVAAGELLPLICLLKSEQALVVEALWVQELAPGALPEQVVQVLPGVVVQVLPAASVRVAAGELSSLMRASKRELAINYAAAHQDWGGDGSHYQAQKDPVEAE